MRASRALLPLAIAAVALWGGPASAIERDDAGVAILVPPDRAGVVAELQKAITTSRRFHLVPADGIAVTVKPPLFDPEPPVSLARRNSWQSLTQAHWLLLGRADQQDGPPEHYSLHLRVFDLELGDVGPLYDDTATDPAAIASQAVRFLRAHFPIKATVTALKDGSVYLDVGKQDGVVEGEEFVIERHPETMRQRVATVLVTTAADWFSNCDVEDSAKGLSPQVGDAAIEDTSSYLSN